MLIYNELSFHHLYTLLTNYKLPRQKLYNLNPSPVQIPRFQYIEKQLANDCLLPNTIQCTMSKYDAVQCILTLNLTFDLDLLCQCDGSLLGIECWGPNAFPYTTARSESSKSNSVHYAGRFCYTSKNTCCFLHYTGKLLPWTRAVIYGNALYLTINRLSRCL